MGKLIPILFNTEMVKAIMDGRKTVTRRLLKPQPEFFFGETGTPQQCDNGSWCFKIDQYENMYDFGFKPPCQPGDILYVRETWRVASRWGDISKGTSGVRIEYKAGGDLTLHNVGIAFENIGGYRWWPSIHMPKQAARIFLKVKAVRVERLQAITDEDAIKEGCVAVPCDCANKDEHGCVDCLNTGWIETPAAAFMCLWDTTIKPAERPKLGWGANPWVWVIEFEKCEKPVDVPDANVGKKENGNEI